MLPRKPVFIPLLMVLVLLISACGGEGEPAANASAANTPAPTPANPGPDVAPPANLTESLAALVNGEPIPLAAYESELHRREVSAVESGNVPADRAAFEAWVLTVMIDQVLIEQAALIQGLAVTDEELEAEIALNIELAGSEDAWQAWLAANLYTVEEFRAAIYSNLLTIKVRDQVLSGMPTTAEQAHARHILVSTQAEAATIHQQLLNGTDFGELAFAHSRDVSTRQLGGDLGWFARDQLTEPVVADIAFSLEPGEISQPVASRLGYHIIQTLERVPDRPLDDRARVLLEENVFERWLQSLRDQANVQRFIGGT